MFHWLGHAIAWTWGDRQPGQGVGYAISSGPLPCLLACGFLAAWFRRHNCHIRRCPRLQWHVDPEHGHPVCRHHHKGL